MAMTTSTQEESTGTWLKNELMERCKEHPLATILLFLVLCFLVMVLVTAESHPHNYMADVANQKASEPRGVPPLSDGGENYIGFPKVINAYLVTYPKCRKAVKGWPSSKCLAGMWAANVAYADAHPELDDQSECQISSPAGTFFSKRCRADRQRISDNIDAEDAKQHVHVCINGSCATSSVWTDANGDVHVSAQKD